MTLVLYIFITKNPAFKSDFLSKMALFGPLLGVSTVGLVTVLYIFLTRLRRARGLLVQRQKMGLVKS